jgi:SNF2 family DNA or RNA helicase
MEVSKKAFGPYTLLSHQIAAVQWMIQREEDEVMRGGFLCDDLGLGKTVSTVGLMINKPVAMSLVLAPLAVLRQWISTVTAANGPAVYELRKGDWRCVGGNVRLGRVFVTNYDKLVKGGSMFEMRFNRIICDEAHTLRSYMSKKTVALRKLTCDKYWFLTGTPIVNGGSDLTCLVSLANSKVRPFIGYRAQVMESWMGDWALHRTAGQMRELLGDMLPKPAIIREHRLPFATEDEALFYRGIQGRIAARLAHLMEQDRGGGLAMLTLLLRLRQISVHPQVYIKSKKKNGDYLRPDWEGDSTKTEAIVKILKEEKEGHGYVIFCNFKEEVDILRERLMKEACVGTVLTYDGSMSEAARSAVIMESEEAMARTSTEGVIDALKDTLKLPTDIIRNIAQFKGPAHTVLLAQIQCAGTGLNLQHFDRVIFTTPWWTAALMDQAAGRVLRLGQRKQVVIHYIHLEEEGNVSLNIDDFINEKVEEKRELCQRLLAASDRRVMPIVEVN